MGAVGAVRHRWLSVGRNSLRLFRRLRLTRSKLLDLRLQVLNHPVEGFRLLYALLQEIYLELKASKVLLQIREAGFSGRSMNRVAETDLHKYMKALPAVKREAYRRARELWDTGVTSNQIQGSYDVLDVLTQALVHLASWYAEGHFGDGRVVEYMSSLISSRFVWHRALLEPGGAGTGGTIVGPLTAGAVMDDVEDMVVDMVRSLTMDLGAPEDEAEFDFGTWEHQWRRVK